MEELRSVSPSQVSSGADANRTALTRGWAAPVLLLRNYVLRRDIFLLKKNPPLQPASPCRHRFAPESELAADTLAALSSRAESCNHLDSVCMFNLSQHSGLLHHTISAVLEIVQFIKRRHNKWGKSRRKNAYGMHCN